MKHKKIRCANERKVALVPFCFFSLHYFSYLNFLFFKLFYLKKMVKQFFHFLCHCCCCLWLRRLSCNLKNHFSSKKKNEAHFLKKEKNPLSTSD
ncbi:hypothetical protein DPX39_090076700 [Trypanosoma brucei equiperdum]|uniref:Uncharacterized protein n=1 Tax=Trypanosoma brucei equiperdum TaxID=630700 RepID=A0A3L6L148_9TRYP|nr:hypothetical protein DPX39_090076700 [Trypanosoma brucei equiperdum]